MCAEVISIFDRVPAGTVFAAKTAAPADLQSAALWLLYQGDRVVVAGGKDHPQPLLAPAATLEPQPLRSQYLGCWDEGGEALHCFAGELPAESELPPGLVAVDLRDLFGVWDEHWIGLAGRAKQVAHWARDHQFCGRCGAATEEAAGERARRCPRCGLTSYPRISPAIIIAVTRQIEGGEEILLARNHRFPAGRYSVVAGFVEPGETLEECAVREVQEEVGVRITNIRYFGSQPWPFPNSLMIGFTADYAGGDICLEDSEIADAQWFGPANMPQLPPKISIARRLIDSYVQRTTDLQRADL